MTGGIGNAGVVIGITGAAQSSTSSNLLDLNNEFYG